MDKSIYSLISEMEYLVGKECYNINSYNGWTGDEGCSLRYPVQYLESIESNILTKTRFMTMPQCDKSIESMKYVFGSNHLFIGKGLTNVLTMLEKRYCLDFSELEKSYLNSKNQME